MDIVVCAPPEMPQFLFDVLSHACYAGTKKGNLNLDLSQVKAPPINQPVEQGQRNDTLARLAGKWVAQGLDEAEVQVLAKTWNDGNTPPLGEKELLTTLASIRKTHDRHNPEPSLPFFFDRVGDIEIRPPDWLVKPLIERDTLNVLFGDSAAGKSFLAVSLAGCVASGKDFYGHPIRRPGSVAYIAGEGRNGITRRFKAWCIRNGVDLKNLDVFVSNIAAGLTVAEQAVEVTNALKDIAKVRPPVLVVIDTLARNFGPGDENKTQDMTAFVAALDRIRAPYQSAMLVVHHTGLMNKERARGNMALRAALDTEWRMDKDDTGTIRMDNTKMKDHAPPEPMAFALRSVDLGLVDEDGEPVTSAVMDQTSYEPPAVAGKAGRGKWQTKAMEVLGDILETKQAKAGETGVVRVSVEEWRTSCAVQGVPRQRFYQLRDALCKQDIIQIVNGFVEI